MNADDPLDRTTNPELTGLFDALDELATPPADAVRARQVRRAALAAGTAASATAAPSRWGWRRAASWQAVAAAAAIIAIVAGLGADDRLPEPAQRVVSSVADAVGLEIPDGSTRGRAVDDQVEGLETPDGTVGRSGTTPAVPADPGTPGEPATPATPADPANRDGTGNGLKDDKSGAEPATPAEPGEPSDPATPATPADPPENPDAERQPAEPENQPAVPEDPPGASAEKSPAQKDGQDDQGEHD